MCEVRHGPGRGADVARQSGIDLGHVRRLPRQPGRRRRIWRGRGLVRFNPQFASLEAILSHCAEQALGRTDAWPAFADFFTALALLKREHAGSSESLDDRGGPLVAAAKRRLIDLMRGLADRAQRQGVLRADLAWRDIPFLARIAAFGTCALDVPGDAIQVQRCIIVVLDGMGVAAVTPLPDHATDSEQELAIPQTI